MIYPEKEIVLKGGKAVLFRSPKKEDAAEMVEYLKETAGETVFIMRYPEECCYSIEDEEEILESKRLSEREVMIVCEVDGKIAGNCSLMFNRHIKTAHRATVGIALLKEYWGMGIGSAMFEEMIRLAGERGVLQMELQFVEGNDRARHLYEKFGFRIAGIIPDAIRLKDGTLLNEYHMIKKL
ncbi:MAG: GNAT family N-acetyltransferase [Eubacteriales bacterium]